MKGAMKQTNMADSAETGFRLLKNTKIIVVVEEAIEDLIVVSFKLGCKLFQGVLLDATKKNVPCGVNHQILPLISPDSTDETTKNQENVADRDKLYSVSQRHTYVLTPEDESQPPKQQRRPLKSFRAGNVRTMRLRPRQVLCSKCRSICNENSENVEIQNTRKGSQTLQAVPNKNESVQLKPRPEPLTQPSFPASDATAGKDAENRMVLRKRRSVDIMPSNKEVEKKTRKTELDAAQEQKMMVMKTSPVIKISFGPQGQGTVLKIPPRSHTYEDNLQKEEKTENVVAEVQPVGVNHHSFKDPASAKAAKKALKKAKKEAQKKALNAAGSSPTTFHHHKSRHHKHKFKHKRKHREDGSLSPLEEKLAENIGGNEECLKPSKDLLDNWNASEDSSKSDNYSEIKKECLRQKLSISLKRLNAKAYMQSSQSYNEDSNSTGTSSNNSDSNSNSDPDDVPEFPENDPPQHVEKVKPLMMRISSHNVKSCTLADGRTMNVGDIVWGKIHGFPWWPGKVLSITVSQRDNGILITQQAHVAWFGSSTSSYMPCSQLAPFLEYFKTRYNKKKRGPYKEAIKQATLAAQQVLQEMDEVDVET